MHGSPPRLGIKLAVLAALWIVVYWLTPSPRQMPPSVADASTLTRPPETPATDAPLAVPTPETVDNTTPAEAVIVETLPSETEPASESLNPAPPPVTPPPYTLHTVSPRETIEDIAVAHFGDRIHWQAIAQMNPGVDPIRLRAGQQLRIPTDLRNLQGVANQNAPLAAPPELIYLVADGDTLSEISLKVYGRSMHWRRIQQANADTVNAEGTNLRPGMELRIPTLPADTRN